MIFSFVFQLFLASALPQTEVAELGLRPPSQASAALEGEMELIKGFDQSTSTAFAHSLPKVGDTGFGPQRLETNSLGVLTSADSAIVIDKRTSKVLFEKQTKEIRPIASITKLVTVLVLLDQELDFQSIVTINPLDRKDGGRIWVYQGEQFTIQDLWMDGLIASDNVAIMALVRNSGLSWEEFIDAMNDKAKELGMEDSSFIEPTGISRYNVSTASDLALLYQEVLSKTEVLDAIRRPTYSFSPVNKDAVRSIENTNKLLGSYLNQDDYSILAGKTGFTYEAGYCLGVIVDGPLANDDLIVIALGADTIDARFQDVKGLIDWTYRNFNW